MAKWIGNSIESFKKHFKHNVEIDGQVDINNTLNYDGEDSKYLVLNNNDVLSYRSVGANLRADIGDASLVSKGVVELATTAETTTGTDSSRAVTPAGAAALHATVQTGKNYRIINTSFRDDIGTTKHYLPLKAQDEFSGATITREEVAELAVCDGRLVSATVRLEQMSGSTGDFTLTMGVETNVVGIAYSSNFSVIETENITANTDDDQHVFHFVFSDAKHWDSTDMFAISIESSSDEWGSNERFYVTLVIEDDWTTYLAGTTREIDSTP